MSADRRTWFEVMQRVAMPVLRMGASGELYEALENWPREGVSYRSFEAVARTLNGIAPWLEATGLPEEELEVQHEAIGLAQRAIAYGLQDRGAGRFDFDGNHAHPNDPYMPHQGLVEAAFLSQAILRAPTRLWLELDSGVQQMLIMSLERSRARRTWPSNWLLFSAMVECAFHKIGLSIDPHRVDTALSAMSDWYVGDGVYGDGPNFHFDYYNSFVIHPFLVDIVSELGGLSSNWGAQIGPVFDRARRYAAIQERLISSEGTYPVVGRSMAYRFGAFHLLAQSALRDDLPAEVSASQVRSALTSVLRRFESCESNFLPNGLLSIGVQGVQPGLGETYISGGSVYLCCSAFLPLGLPTSAPFWSEPDRDWTSKRVWGGGTVPIDRAI